MTKRPHIGQRTQDDDDDRERSVIAPPASKRRIEVHPDQVSQRDPRLKVGPSLDRIVVRFVAISALLVMALLVLALLGPLLLHR